MTAKASRGGWQPVTRRCTCADCGREFEHVRKAPGGVPPARCPECKAERMRVAGRRDKAKAYWRRREMMGLGPGERAYKAVECRCADCGRWFLYESYGHAAPKRCPECTERHIRAQERARRRARRAAGEPCPPTGHRPRGNRTLVCPDCGRQMTLPPSQNRRERCPECARRHMLALQKRSRVARAERERRGA